jgi:peroxiredoxin
LVQLQKDLPQIEAAGVRVVAVSYDSTEVLKKFAEEHDITFPLLSDQDSKTIDAYGIRNRDVRSGSRQDGIPHPGTFLIEPDGRIRAKIFYTVRKRHSSDELIKAAQ